MRIRFSDPVQGGHEIQIVTGTDIKFMGSLVLATTGVSQQVVARVAGRNWKVVATGDIFRKCEILATDEIDPLAVPNNRR